MPRVAAVNVDSGRVNSGRRGDAMTFARCAYLARSVGRGWAALHVQ